MCNWVVPVGAGTLCPSCELNRTIPDLTALGNRAAWHKIEIAKRRNLYTLARLGLTPVNKKQDAVNGLAFDFLRPTGSAQVLTGHEDGLITLNVEDAEDTEREKRKELLGEMYRTLVGHFRHEIAHFYWDRFFQGRADDDPILQGFREVFGDEREDYTMALQRHYSEGPVASAPGTTSPTKLTAPTSARPCRLGGMTDPKQIRINDAEDPDRAAKFNAALRRTAGTGNLVIRQLIDAFIRYVEDHGHGPTFPVDITPQQPPARRTPRD